MSFCLYMVCDGVRNLTCYSYVCVHLLDRSRTLASGHPPGSNEGVYGDEGGGRRGRGGGGGRGGVVLHDQQLIAQEEEPKPAPSAKKRAKKA